MQDASFRSAHWLLLATSLAVLASCGKSVNRDGSNFSQMDAPSVCIPSGPGTPGAERNGLLGKIAYLDDAQPRVTHVNELLTSGHDAGVQLFLNRVNVPTTRFTAGFLDSATGIPLKRPSGDVLVEWFALDLHSELLLMPSEADGYYQFALIADDGAILDLEADDSTPASTLVNNDGVHGTKMGCSAKAIRLAKDNPRPIRLRYFQGPRDHITLTLMWKKVATETAALDALCGKMDLVKFWNSATVPSTPGVYTNELISRGWKTLSHQNFVLPSEAPSNPCVSSI